MRRLLVPAALAACTLAIYFTSLQNYVANGDTAEFQTTATILGINHPTGFPAFTLLGWAFTHALPFVDLTARLGVMSSVLVAIALVCGCALSARLGASAGLTAACFAVVAAGSTFWDAATRAEVHTMALCASAGALLAVVAWRQTHAPAALICTLGLLGLALATHPVAIWTVAACAIVIAAEYRRLTVRRAAFAALAFLGGFALYAYLPIRSAIVVAKHLDPGESIGLPPGNAFWNYADPSTLRGFFRLTTGSDFDKSPALLSVIDVNAWPAHLSHIAANATFDYGWVLPALALAGLIAVIVRDRIVAAALLVFGLAPALFVLEYGAESSPGRYFLPCYLMLGVLAAAGASWPASRLSPAGRRIGIALLLCVAAVTVVEHRDRFGRYDGGPALFRTAILSGTDDRGIVLIPWLYGTQLAFFADAERSLGHRVVVIGYLSDDAQYFGSWLQQRRVYVLKQDVPVMPGYGVVHTTQGLESIVEVVRR